MPSPVFRRPRGHVLVVSHWIPADGRRSTLTDDQACDLLMPVAGGAFDGVDAIAERPAEASRPDDSGLGTVPG